MRVPLESVLRILRSVVCAAAFLTLGCADDTTRPDPSALPAQPILITTSWTWSGVAAGAYHTCAIKTDGTVVCWGSNYYGQTSVPGGLGTVKQIVAAGDVSCAIRTDDNLVCWGRNDVGQIYNPPTLPTVKQVASSGYHTCAIKFDDTLACWGWNGYNQIHIPFDIGAVKRIATGAAHSCAIKANDRIVCWGTDLNDQASGYDMEAKEIAAGGAHNCLIKPDDTVYCWAMNLQGQASVPVGLGTVKQISAGEYHTCAIRTDDTLVCWGLNNDGQSSVPAGLGAVKQVWGGNDHTCALKADDTIVCWGWNGVGALNVPATNNRYAPSATFTAPAAAEAATSFALELSAAQVVTPGGTLSAEDAGITYAFDCGSGYGAFSSSATAACTAGSASTQTVKGKVKDRDGDATEYSATLDITFPPITGLTGKLASTTVRLSWIDSSSRETYFVIQRSTFDGSTWGDWQPLGQTSGDASSYDDIGEPGKSYRYSVRPCDGTSCATLWSGSVRITISDPAAPANLTASVESPTAVNLVWDDVAGETLYEIYGAQYDGTAWSPWVKQGEAVANWTTITIVGLSTGMKHKFSVRACRTVCSPFAYTPVIRTPAEPPANVRVGSAAKEITWDDRGTGELRFEVQRRDFVGGVWTPFAPLGDTAPNEVSFFDTSRPAGKFRYRVRACYTIGCSAYASSAVITGL